MYHKIYNKLCHMKIQTRLLLIVLMAVASFMSVTYIILRRHYVTAQNAHHFRELTELAPAIGQLIHDLQKERDVSAIYISSSGGADAMGNLNVQRARTDGALKAYVAQMARKVDSVYGGNLRIRLRAADDSLSRLSQERQDVTGLLITNDQMTGLYSHHLQQLLAIIYEMESLSDNHLMTKRLIAYINFMEAKERTGLERAFGTIGFQKGRFEGEIITKFISQIAKQESYMQIFMAYASPASIDFAHKVMSGRGLQDHLRHRAIAVASLETGSTENITASVWFKAVTERINVMQKVEGHLVTELVTLSSGVENRALTYFYIILIASLLASLIIMVGTYVIFRSISRPLAEITKAMHDISEGNLIRDIPHKNMPNSVGKIARALCIFRAKVIENIALEKQAQQQREKAAERKLLILDFEKSERAREELKKLKDIAETANQSKSEFLAIMSHELRTPLNAIIGFSDIMRLGMLGDHQTDIYVEYAADINVSAVHLLDIINDILILSNIETKRLQLSENKTSLQEIIHPIISILSQNISDKEMTLNLDEHQLEDIIMIVDKSRFKLIMLNLISNAVKFTPHGGEVSVSAVLKAETGLEIIIKDSGIGMQHEDISKAMSPFMQIDSALNRRYEGTGLGLSLAKKLVELHGGKLALKSQLGVGTTVIISLPNRRLILEKAQKGMTGKMDGKIFPTIN